MLQPRAVCPSSAHRFHSVLFHRQSTWDKIEASVCSLISFQVSRVDFRRLWRALVAAWFLARVPQSKARFQNAPSTLLLMVVDLMWVISIYYDFKMNVVALLSGGKDSLYNMYLATKDGHQIVAIANLKPPEGKGDELDSYMYQTVGHQAIEMIAQALDKPLFRADITGTNCNKDLDYNEIQDANDEVEHLYQLLKNIKESVEFDAISVGAIASSYQKSRVENICKRLNLKMLAYLWDKDQDSLLQDMIDNQFLAILIKVACMGLNKQHVGQSIEQMQGHLRKLHSEYKTNVCGEGGEYESLVLDCPLYKKRIVLDEYEIVCHSSDIFAPVYYLRPIKLSLQEK